MKKAATESPFRRPRNSAPSEKIARCPKVMLSSLQLDPRTLPRRLRVDLTFQIQWIQKSSVRQFVVVATTESGR